MQLFIIHAGFYGYKVSLTKDESNTTKLINYDYTQIKQLD